jgi:hypothetical protein
MRTTVELPDELFRRVKATAALRGRKLKDLVEEGLRIVLESPGIATDAKRPPSAWDEFKDACGIVKSGVNDLATNPKHMKGFGRDSKRHR